ncbi:UAA transporter family protein [Ancylostoma duodenale]|uniref:UAA transporter family protein n=2 Tax=Ancylostoma TaxID=29169 RepID=A0A0C2BT79_9BILA|nr:UAA transporter family protein [Ancylostoma duodenale]
MVLVSMCDAAMSSPIAPILGVLGGCMGCMVFVEKIAKQEPSSMNLMTFSTFLFIASQGLIFTSKFFTVPNKIPLRGYIPTVITFFTVNVVNNQALNFHVPNSGLSYEEAVKHYHEWMIGIAMLIFALLASAYLAICQQRMYETYGKYPEEAIYYCIRFVYRLNAEVEALTVTLVVTLRKFLSLVVSIWWFQNPFTGQHWIGAFLVFAGTLAFADIWSRKELEKKNK